MVCYAAIDGQNPANSVSLSPQFAHEVLSVRKAPLPFRLTFLVRRRERHFLLLAGHPPTALGSGLLLSDAVRISCCLAQIYTSYLKTVRPNVL